MKAILPVFDDSRVEPYYMQLYSYMKKAITDGDIAEGERLPSLRSLARSTGLSVTTIEKAYDQLLVEGYIYSRAQSGFYAGRVSAATQGVSPTVPYQNMDSGQKLSSSKKTDLPGTDKKDPGEDKTGGDDLPAPLLYDPDCFDFNKWKKCMNRVLNEESPSLFFEGSPQGESALRIQIARYLYQSRGVSCHPDQIVIAAGTQQITNHLSTVLRSLQVEHIALEEPGYTPVRNTFRDRGFAITPVDVAEDGLILEKLPVNIRAAVYVSPSNHSFTGSVMPIGRRYELIRWAMTNDSYIIEDDYDSELRYFGRPIPALRSLTDDGRVIYLGSFSSTLFAAVKISYMVLPPAIADQFALQLKGYSQTCSKLEQLTLAMFMETGAYQTHIRKLRKLYAQKLSQITDIFRRRAKDFIRVRSSASGISILLEVHSPKSSDQLKQDAELLGVPVSIVPGADSEESSPDSHLLLLNYNQIPLSEIEKLLTDLIRRWRS